MKFEEQLNKYSGLKNQLNNNTLSESTKANLRIEFEAVRKYLFDTYMIVRLKTGIYKGSDFNFEKWVDNEIEQNDYINNLLADDNYDVEEPNEQVIDFDNLGFNNSFVVNWRNNILSELKNQDVVMSDFYLTENNKNNKNLLEHIVLKSETYNHLNNKNLLNKGYCPITGEKIETSYSYNSYGRHIYLSKTGLEICKGVNRENWKGNNMSYDEFENLKSTGKEKGRKQASAVVFILVILSIIISWNMVSPTGLFSFLGFIIVGFIVFFILGWMFNFLWDMFT